jgi:Flp pilus assembly protein TadG
LILFPFVLLLAVSVIQAGVFFHARDVARSAANGGALAGALEGGSAAAAQSEAQSRIDRAGGTSLLESSSVTATRTATQVTVTVEGRALTFLPLLPDLDVTQSVSAPAERFTAP